MALERAADRACEVGGLAGDFSHRLALQVGRDVGQMLPQRAHALHELGRDVIDQARKRMLEQTIEGLRDGVEVDARALHRATAFR